eukprot:3031009-Pyramimonas_sp.AAC.1
MNRQADAGAVRAARSHGLPDTIRQQHRQEQKLCYLLQHTATVILMHRATELKEMGRDSHHDRC